MIKLFFKQFLVCCLIAILVFPAHVFAGTRNGSGKSQTIAIVPVANSNQSNLLAINKELSLSIHENLKNTFNLLDPKSVARIMKTNFKKTKSLKTKDPELVEIIRMIKHSTSEYAKSKDSKYALKTLDRAIDSIKKKNLITKDMSALLVSAKLYKSWILFNVDEKQKSAQIIKEILSVNKESKINLSSFSKKYADFIQGQKKSIVYDSKILVNQTRPKSVNVHINDIYVGQSPLEITVPNGKWSLSLSSENRKTYTRKINLSKKAKYHLPLTSLAWARKTDNEVSSQNILSAEQKLSMASTISMVSKARKVVFVDTQLVNGKYLPSVQIVDPKYNQVYKQIQYKKYKDLKKTSTDAVDYFSAKLASLLIKDSLDLYQKDFDNSLIIDPRIESLSKKPWYQQKSVWAAAGVVVVGGIVTGLILANSGSSGDGTGSVTIGFDDFK